VLKSRSLTNLSSLAGSGLENASDRRERSVSFADLLQGLSSSAQAPGEVLDKPLPGKKRPRTLLFRFQEKLAGKVTETFRQAGAESRLDILEDVFYDISATIPRKVTERLGLDDERRHWSYYELLATYYYVLECRYTPGEVERTFIPLCAPLWSHEFFPAIFTMLMHRWLVETDAGRNGKGWLMHFNFFLKGTHQMFLFDVEHESKKLWPVFIRLREHMFVPSSEFFPHDLEEVGSSTLKGKTTKNPNNAAKERIRRDFAVILCRFYFYYSSRPERVQAFCINQLQLEEGLDEFIPELIYQLRNVKTELALKRFLRGAAKLPMEDIHSSSKNRLYATLNELQLPGAPLHPTPGVIQQAEQTMNTLFPQGRWVRFIINLFFRLLHPFFLPAFLLNLFHRKKEKDN